MRRAGAVAIAVALGVLAHGGATQALTDEEIFREFTFNFVSPGPRALGLGGAFSAAAADPTAIRANPAALHYVTDTQFFGEFRSIDRDPLAQRSQLGSLDVDPTTGDRELPFLGLTSVSEAETANEPTFVGAAWSTLLGQPGRRLTVAGARQVLFSEDRVLGAGGETNSARFAFESFPNTVNNGTVQAYSVETRVTGGSAAEIVLWTAGASLEVHRDFSVGVAAGYATLDLRLDTTTRVLDPLELFLDPQHPRLPAEPQSDVFRTTIDDSDSDVMFSVGIHWHPDSIFGAGESPWRFAAVYRKGATFEVDEATFVNEDPDETFANTIVVPDRYSIGATYQGGRFWRVAAEVERVEYSDMLEGFKSGVNFLTSGRVAGGGFGVDPEGSVEFAADDATVPRLGVEYARPLAGEHQFSVQAGYYRQRAGGIHMTRFNSDDEDVNDAYLEAFRKGEDVDHVTAGAGYRFGPWGVHFAGDFSDEGTQVVGAFVYTLGGE